MTNAKGPKNSYGHVHRDKERCENSHRIRRPFASGCETWRIIWQEKISIPRRKPFVPHDCKSLLVLVEIHDPSWEPFAQVIPRVHRSVLVNQIRKNWS